VFHKAGFKGKVVADRDKIPNAVANIGLAELLDYAPLPHLPFFQVNLSYSGQELH
jgi:hypothetical protein